MCCVQCSTILHKVVMAKAKKPEAPAAADAGKPQRFTLSFIHAQKTNKKSLIMTNLVLGVR